MLSVEEKKAVQESIEHWETDIIAELLKGRKIKKNGSCRKVTWEDSGRAVPCYEINAILCKSCSPGCGACPYYKAYGCRCADIGEPWDGFIEKPTIENARAMVDKLRGLL